MDTTVKEALERVREACQGKERVDRYVLKKVGNNPKKQRVHECALVELIAADILTLCAAVEEPSQVVLDLKMGSEAGQPNRAVCIKVVDADRLMAAAAGE